MDDKDPGLVAICGDWHGNARWGREVIKQISTLLPIWQKKIILQAGDFGVWDPPGEVKVKFPSWSNRFLFEEAVRDSYLTEIENALAHANAELWFIDGNHEDHPLLAELTRDSPWITPHIKHLSRGSRWEWHGKKWLALGGAVSVDKNLRVAGISWHPEEAITQEQKEKVIREGKADVLLSHDAPAWVPLNLNPDIPKAWLPQIPFAEAHRKLMSEICESVQPSWIFHGHYHIPANQFLSVPWGECRVVSLDMNGETGNWGLLNLESMTWEKLQPPLLAESMSTQILVIAEILPLKLTVAGAQPFQLPGLNLRCLPQAGTSMRKHPCHPGNQGHPQPPQQARGPGRGIPDHPPVLVRAMPDQVRPTAGEKRGTGDYCMENETSPRV